jgi:tetratricopeptide (TPR) repeat protein
MERSANLEAITHLQKALDVLRALPDTPHRFERELELQTLLCVPLVATKSITSPEVGQAYQSAWELYQRVGRASHGFSSLLGLYRFHTLRGEFHLATPLEEQLLELAQTPQDLAQLVEVHRRLGVTRFHRGEFAAALLHCQQASAYYQPQQHHAQVYIYGWVDAGVSVLGYEAYALWHLGYPTQALARAQAALRLAEVLSHPLSLAFAHHFIARVHQHRREIPQVQEHAEQAIAISSTHAFPARHAAGLILRGWAVAMQGQVDAGLSEVQQGLQEVERLEAGVVTRPYFLALLAEVYARQQQFEAAFASLERAVACMHSTDYEAEIYRLRGELILAQGRASQAEAEACFSQALHIARRQQARMPELRAALSLCQAWILRGKLDQARQCLPPLYHGLSEGFETADMQAAKQCIAALGG